ncbi:MAG: prolyl oligopeptidase family serine peptidase [Nodosilinea sp. LVE1205-7]
MEGLLGVKRPEILSPLSPDGTTLVMAVANLLEPANRTLYFLDIKTGEMTPALALQSDLLNPDLPLQWVNNDTIRFVQQDAFGPWEILAINRKAGIVSRTQIYPAQEESGEILGVAPDFSKVLIRLYEGNSDGLYTILLPSLKRLEIGRISHDISLQPPSWSADGKRLALVVSAATENHRYDRSPTNPSLADPAIQDALGRLAPDHNPLAQQNKVQVFDFSQTPIQQFELNPSHDNGDSLGAAHLSQNGQHLLVKRLHPAQLKGRPYPIYGFPDSASYQVYDRHGKLESTIQIPTLQGPQESMGQFLDSDRLLFWASVGSDRHLFVYHLSSQDFKPLPLPAGTVDPQSLTPSADGNSLIYSFSSITQPPELYSQSTKGEAAPRPLTTINADVASLNQVRVDQVSFATSQGVRQGFLIQPQDRPFPPQAGPVVFWQEGGPGFSMGNEFAVTVEMPFNLLPNFGLPVLVVPLSGREGFGPDFYRRQADGNNFGMLDLQEGREVIDQMVQRGWASRDRVGMTGCSYGGYYTAQILTRFPQLFAAANPQCSLLDTLTEWQLGYGALLSYLIGQTPMENPQRYQSLSPLYNATAIRTPTLLFHGTQDFLPIAMVRNFHDLIAASGVPVTLYEFQETGHALVDPLYQRLAVQLQLEFFHRYLADSQNGPDLNRDTPRGQK